MRRAVLGPIVDIKLIYIINSHARPRKPVPSGLPGFNHITAYTNVIVPMDPSRRPM